MLRKHLLLAAVGVLSVAASAVVYAQAPPVTAGPTVLLAGPGEDYPPVVQLGPGYPLTVYGCVAGYTWCDVSYQAARGWVDAREIDYPYQTGPVPVAVYGATLGVPVVSFDINTYWGHWYHDRPWFGRRGEFVGHAPPPARWAPGGRAGWSNDRRAHYEHFEHDQHDQHDQHDHR